jgi:UPF0716 protein FxsA
VNKSKLLAYVLTGWLFVEIVAFVLVVELLGVLAAVALGVGTTLLGLADVKRLFLYLRSRIGQPRAETKSGVALLDGGLEAVGALLLILPGFASDLVGLALKSPSIRARVADHIRGKTERRGPQTIDLSPGEWKAIVDEGPKRRMRSRRSPPIKAV